MIAQIGENLRPVGLMGLLLFVLGLACNAPGDGATETTTVTITASSTVIQTQPTLGAPETLPAIVPSSSAETIDENPLPTFTPIQPPTLAATLTPSSTPTPRPSSGEGGSPKATPTSTGTPADSEGPLRFDYHIEWRLKDSNQAIASVTITAHGGGGGYTYFRDELPLEGPIFEYNWGTCAGNPGSFRVTSADGQSVKRDYFESPPCPTPIPSP